MERKLPLLEPLAFGTALVVLVLGAAGGPAWKSASNHAASAPLYDALAAAVAQLPVGEPGFRLAVLGAALGALTLTGVIAAARALLPKDPLAGAIAAVLLLLAPPFRTAAGFADPTILAACGSVWAVAFTIAHARAPAARLALAAIAAAAAVLGSAPWLGVALLAVIAALGWRAPDARGSRTAILAGLGATLVLALALWLGAYGALPAFAPSLTALVAASGVGSAAVVIGTGLLGVAFGALTDLPTRAASPWCSWSPRRTRSRSTTSPPRSSRCSPSRPP